jgi:copper chaperone CopZ
MEARTYVVAGMSCAHCKAAIETEVSCVAGVVSVDASPESKLVVVRGDSLDDDAIRAAIDEAGYEVS